LILWGLTSPENTPLMNNDPLVVPLCNETDLFISQSVKEKIWGLQYINLVWPPYTPTSRHAKEKQILINTYELLA
jgi:hypothetical protein